MSKLDYDVLVIGSGFGGSVAALRLTEKGYRVGVLEAGTPPTDRTREDRAAAVAALTASRIRAGDPAIIGVLARGTSEQLREVAEHPRVRAVEALPADAVWGRFATRPLLPQQAEVASPLPDTAPVQVPAG